MIGPPSDTTSFQMYLRIDRLISAIETFIPREERSGYERDAASYLRLFKALGVRATTSKDETTFTMLISISEK